MPLILSVFGSYELFIFTLFGVVVLVSVRACGRGHEVCGGQGIKHARVRRGMKGAKSWDEVLCVFVPFVRSFGTHFWDEGKLAICFVTTWKAEAACVLGP